MNAITKLLPSGAVAAIAGTALLPTGAAAVDPVLANGLTLTSPSIECVGAAPGDGAGSCNTVFRDRMEVVGLSVEALIETVKLSCPGFPNAAYQRFDNAMNVISPIGYATLGPLSTPVSGMPALSAGDINAQIGTAIDATEAAGTTVTISGTSGSTPSVTVEVVNGDIRSQILDLPGFDFVLFLKSMGGGQQVGTLVCDIKMWFRDSGATSGPVKYGLQDFTVNHNINSITIGFVSGPSGLRSQLRAQTACDEAGNKNAADPDLAILEKKVSYLAGIYKSTPLDPVTPHNVTGCGVDDDSDPVKANYCDQSEVPGFVVEDAMGNITTDSSRPNSCNPEGESGNISQPIVAGTHGNATRVCFGPDSSGSVSCHDL